MSVRKFVIQKDPVSTYLLFYHVSNINGNHLSKYLPKSTNFNDPRAPVNNTTNLAHRFDQNDFFVRVTVPMRDTDVNIPRTIKQTFATFRRADPSFCMIPKQHF